MKPLILENPSDSDNQLVAAIEDDSWSDYKGAPCISVSNGKSYGDECHFHLTDEDAIRLRNWLTAYLTAKGESYK